MERLEASTSEIKDKVGFASIALIRVRRILLNLLVATDSNVWTWKYTIGFYFSVAAILISLPSYEQFLEPSPIVAQNWSALDRQSEQPLVPLHIDPSQHHGQIGLRLLLPLLSHVTGLSMRTWFVTQHLLSVWFAAAIVSLFYAKTRDKLAALIIGASVYLTYLGKSFFVDVIGYYDATAYCLLLAALVAPGYILMTLCMLASLFVDERAYLIIPIIGFAKTWMMLPENKLPSWATLIRSQYIWLALSTVLAGLLLRVLLYAKYGLISGVAGKENFGLATLRENYGVLIPALLSGLDCLLLLAWVPCIYLWIGGQRLLSLSYGLYLIMAVASCLIVLDITRCTTYFFPAVLLGFWVICHYELAIVRNRILQYGLILVCLFPPVFVVGASIVWMGPFLPKSLRLLAHLCFGLHL